MGFAAQMSVLTEQLSSRLIDGTSIEHRDLSTKLQNLSKFIDHAVATNLKLNQQQLIVKCFKQFKVFKYDQMMRPSVMMLLRSIKSACLAGWFSSSEVEELLETCKYLSEQFLPDGKCRKPLSLLGGPVLCEISYAQSFISMICRRYYPRLTVKSVLVALVINPGRDSLGIDFQVTSRPAISTKLKLFVCQKDDTETSACLVTPPLLSFLVNGKGVEKRVYVATTPEPGPQFPSDITSSLRIGCNSLQIVGENEASCFVAVTIMSSVVWPASSPRLEDYVSPLLAAETDGDVTVGRTRVSLRCPVSLTRISTPVKGVSCRHHQAFDYDSYIEINGRRPSWRCPCCNTYVNCSELRLDRQMNQILKEVDENVLNVVINHDGSWVSDVPADETDVAQVESEGPVLDYDLAQKLEERVIIISDDEEDDHRVGTLASPRESCIAQGSNVSTPSVPLVDHVIEKKHDIRANFASEVVGPAPTQTDVAVSTRPRPFFNAIYSSISEIPQGRPAHATVARATSIQDSQGRYMNTTQSAVRLNSSSWVPDAGFLSTTYQPSDRSSVTMEGQFKAEPSSTIVIQALPGQKAYSNPRHRVSVILTGQVGTRPTMPTSQVPRAGQTTSLRTTQAPVEVRALQQQLTNQQELQNGEKLKMPFIQMLRQLQRQQAYNQSSAAQMQLNHDSIPCDQRYGQQPPKKKLRDARAQRFRDASSHQTGQGQQSSIPRGQHMHYPINSSGDNSLQVQDYSQRHHVYEQLQENAQTISSPISSSLPVENNGGSPSGRGTPTEGLRRDSASQVSSNSIYSGRTKSVSNVPTAGISHSYGVERWVTTPQLAHWRQSGTRRMRGAITIGFTAGMNSGLSASNISSMAEADQLGNVVNGVLAHTTGRGITLWADRNPFKSEGSGELCTAPESASTTNMLEDCSGPSIVLGDNQKDDVGHTGPAPCTDD